MMLSVMIIFLIIAAISLWLTFNPIFRGWLKLRRGFCPLCNSSPPSELCNICHGETNYGRELSLYDRNIWWSRYRTYIYLEKEK